MNFLLASDLLCTFLLLTFLSSYFSSSDFLPDDPNPKLNIDCAACRSCEDDVVCVFVAVVEKEEGGELIFVTIGVLVGKGSLSTDLVFVGVVFVVVGRFGDAMLFATLNRNFSIHILVVFSIILVQSVSIEKNDNVIYVVIGLLSR